MSDPIPYERPTLLGATFGGHLEARPLCDSLCLRAEALRRDRDLGRPADEDMLRDAEDVASMAAALRDRIEREVRG